jgi:hypothetical protein
MFVAHLDLERFVLDLDPLRISPASEIAEKGDLGRFGRLMVQDERVVTEDKGKAALAIEGDRVDEVDLRLRAKGTCKADIEGIG